jgi:hypothetical protein
MLSELLFLLLVIFCMFFGFVGVFFVLICVGLLVFLLFLFFFSPAQFWLTLSCCSLREDNDGGVEADGAARTASVSHDMSSSGHLPSDTEPTSTSAAGGPVGSAVSVPYEKYKRVAMLLVHRLRALEEEAGEDSAANEELTTPSALANWYLEEMGDSISTEAEVRRLISCCCCC